MYYFAFPVCSCSFISSALFLPALSTLDSFALSAHSVSACAMYGCDSTCAVCGMSGICQACANNRFLFEGACLSECPPRFIGLGTQLQGRTCQNSSVTTNCNTVMSGCSVCIGSACVLCSGSNVLYNDTCISSCPGTVCLCVYRQCWYDVLVHICCMRILGS